MTLGAAVIALGLIATLAATTPAGLFLVILDGWTFAVGIRRYRDSLTPSRRCGLPTASSHACCGNCGVLTPQSPNSGQGHWP